jgi:hypothetical protein
MDSSNNCAITDNTGDCPAGAAMVAIQARGSAMSSLHLSSLNRGVSQLLQKVAGTSAGSTAIKAVNAATPTAVQALNKLTSGITGHHHGSSMIQEIQQSVISALKTAQANGDTTDPNQIVQHAIEQVLQGGLSGSSQSAASAASANSPNSADAASQQAFLQTLQSYGVNSAQFHNDFLSAVQNVAANQGTDPGALLKKAPPGLIINLLG